MKDESITQAILLLVFVIVFLSIIFIIVRLSFLESNLTDNNKCGLEYGNDWYYDNNNYFGKSCIKLNFNTLEVEDRILINWDYGKMILKYCNSPGFLDITDWNTECEELVREE